MKTAAYGHSAGDLGWIAVYTKANQETVALSNIERQGYQVYCPMIMRSRRHARKVEMVRRPLFPGYVFANLDNENLQWRPLLSTKGVNGVVRFGDKLGLMPQDLILQLKQCEESNMLQQVAAPRFAPGMKVRIVEGPFDNLIAEVLSLPENERIWLLLDLMGRKVRISHDIWALSQ